MDMDIAAMSVSMSSAKLSQDVGVAVLKKAMASESSAAETMLEMLPPPSGHILDVLA